MTTKAFSCQIRHSSDLEFNQWANLLSTALNDIGMVQTADTGQTTFLGSPLIPRAGTNSDAGYQVWRTNDVTSGSPQVPIYCKFRFGTHGSSTSPRLLLDIGTGTDGAGTVTGSTITGIGLNAANSSYTGNAGPAYFCHTNGFLGIMMGFGNYNSVSYSLMPGFGLLMARSADPDGTPNTNAIHINACSAVGSYNTSTRENRKGGIALNLATGTTYGSLSDGLNGIPGGFLPTLQGELTTVDNTDGSIGVFPFMSAAPQPFIVPSVVCGWDNDIPRYTTFTTTVLGTASHTYLALSHLCLGSSGLIDVGQSYIGSANIAMLWE